MLPQALLKRVHPSTATRAIFQKISPWQQAPPQTVQFVKSLLPNSGVKDSEWVFLCKLGLKQLLDVLSTFWTVLQDKTNPVGLKELHAMCVC